MSQTDGAGRGWGQDMYTYISVPPKMEKYLTSRTIGSVKPRTIWGSALKYSDVWGREVFGNNIFTAADVAKLPIDKVPRWIHYPMGKWKTIRQFIYKKVGATKLSIHKMYYNIFNVDYASFMKTRTKKMFGL